MSTQQRLAKLEANSNATSIRFNNTPYFRASDYIIQANDKQPSRRTVSDIPTSDKYNYRRLA